MESPVSSPKKPKSPAFARPTCRGIYMESGGGVKDLWVMVNNFMFMVKPFRVSIYYCSFAYMVQYTIYEIENLGSELQFKKLSCKSNNSSFAFLFLSIFKRMDKMCYCHNISCLLW